MYSTRKMIFLISYNLRLLKFLLRSRSMRNCSFKWNWRITTGLWFSLLIPAWPHLHPTTSKPELIIWFAMGKNALLTECFKLRSFNFTGSFLAAAGRNNLCFTCRCAADSTYRVYASGFKHYARFGFRAFQFLRAGESVYLQCKVLICQDSDTNSRCRRGCMRRKTRDLQSQHESQTLVAGPIQLKGLNPFSP